MSLISTLFDFALHIDKYLLGIVDKYGTLSYLIIFTVIFLETGLFLTPFLPGDSLLFAVGAFSAVGVFNVLLAFFLLAMASVLGDSANYAIGHFIGRKVFSMKSRFIRKEYLDKTQKFYDKYGAKTIIIARFIPIVRTFAPFLAGVGSMKYFKFLSYNIIGGFAWVAVFIFGGYFFGNIPFVKDHFSLAIIAIILISMIPVGLEVIKHFRQKKKIPENRSNEDESSQDKDN